MKRVFKLTKKYLRYHLLIWMLFQMGAMMGLGSTDNVWDIIPFSGSMATINLIPYIVKKEKLTLIEWIYLFFILAAEWLVFFISAVLILNFVIFLVEG